MVTCQTSKTQDCTICEHRTKLTKKNLGRFGSINSIQFTMTKQKITIATDGAKNKMGGGWAFVTSEGVTRSGGERGTTNNRMEMTAVIEAIDYATDEGISAVIYSDSEYTVKGFNQWMMKWERNGWQRSHSQPVLNSDLWLELFNRRNDGHKLVWARRCSTDLLTEADRIAKEETYLCE